MTTEGLPSRHDTRSVVGEGSPRVLLINPNTNHDTTTAMVAIAQAAAGAAVRVVGATAAFGESVILNETHIEVASQAVAQSVQGAVGLNYSAIIVSAFGEPGLAQARQIARCPVTGLAEASFREAANGGRRFAVVTTTPDLSAAISSAAESYGHGALFAGVVLTDEDMLTLVHDIDRLVASLQRSCVKAVEEFGAGAVIIGGGPLAGAALRLAECMPVAIIQPIPAAIRLTLARIGASTAPRKTQKNRS